MVLSSWQSHCHSEVAANPQTKPIDLDCESARKKWQLPSASTITIYYYSARELSVFVYLFYVSFALILRELVLVLALLVWTTRLIAS